MTAKDKLRYEALRLLVRIKHFELETQNKEDYTESALIHCKHIIAAAEGIAKELKDMRKIK